jgi:hypothetical protein
MMSGWVRNEIASLALANEKPAKEPPDKIAEKIQNS